MLIFRHRSEYIGEYLIWNPKLANLMDIDNDNVENRTYYAENR